MRNELCDNQELFPAVIPIFFDKTCFAFYQKRIFPSIWAKKNCIKKQRFTVYRKIPKNKGTTFGKDVKLNPF
jgi:hypothetical protein